MAKWRGRFVGERLKGLADEPRPGRPRTIADTQVEQVIVATLERPPPDHDSHWSTRSMARQVGMSQSAISRIWRAFGLKPHLEQTGKLSADPPFIDKVRDLVGLYLDPPERALVLCVDERSQIQALDRSAPTLPILPTTPARRAHDDVRHGTAGLFAALNVASGQVISQLHRRHRHQEFLRAELVPQLGDEPRFQRRHKPSQGSWSASTFMIPVLSDTLDGDEQARDRGDACGASCHADDQDSPIGRSAAW